MAPTEEAVVIASAYKESDDHVPSPTDQFGVVDTSGTAGIGDQRIEDISPVFEVATNDALLTAARALDPDDDGVDQSLVTLPQGQNFVAVDPEASKDRVRSLAGNVEPVEVGGPSPSQKAAAEDTSSSDSKAQAREDQETDEKNKPAQQTTTAQSGDPSAAGNPGTRPGGKASPLGGKAR